MIKPEAIDPLALPYVALSELRYLPTCAGVYFAIEECGTVGYIGQSVNIYNRWRGHHVQRALCDLGDLDSARRVRVAWLEVGNIALLDDLERALIQKFRPRLNDSYNRDPHAAPIVIRPAPTGTGLSAAAAAARLGISVRRVQQMVKKGQLPATVFGGALMIQAKDLALVAERKPGRPPKEAKRK